MSFPFNVYLLAVVAACACTAGSLPLWRKWCTRAGFVDSPGPRKIHQEVIPLAGGWAVFTGLVVPLMVAGCVLWFIAGRGPAEAGDSLSSAAGLLWYGWQRRALQLAGILLGATGALFIGAIDDQRELRPGWKFAGQLFLAFIVAASGVRITLFVNNVIFSYAATMLWLLTVMNAFNFIDNMNGLCAGLGLIAAWTFAAVAAADGQYLVALIAFLAAGALLGFLPYNFPRARAFLGDAGSHLLGFLLAVLAILPHFYNPMHLRRRAVLIPLLILAVPLVDLVSVVFIRWRARQPFYQGDNNHFSHRLVRKGFSSTHAVLLLWLAAACCSLAVLLC